MRINRIVAACCSFILAMGASANEKTFEIGRSGFLGNSNRIAFASFSKFKLTVNESAGQLELPCRFVYEPGIVGDKCNEIVFSSVRTERSQKHESQSMPDSAGAAADKLTAMPRRLQIGPLSIEADGPLDDPLDVVFIITEAKGADKCNRHDACLYRRVPETYFRYLSSDELDAECWWVRFLGKRIEYRIRPVCCSGNDYIVEDSDIKSRHFSKMVLAYARRGDDFRLKKIILTGDHLYQGGPFLEEDPAVFEAARIFVESRLIIVENDPDGVVERGHGIMKCQRKMTLKAVKGKSDAQFRVELEMCED